MTKLDDFADAYAVWAASGALSRLERTVRQAAAEALPLFNEGFEVPAPATLDGLANTIVAARRDAYDWPEGTRLRDWRALQSAWRGLTDAVRLDFSPSFAVLSADPRVTAALVLGVRMDVLLGQGEVDVGALEAMLLRSYHAEQARSR